MGVSMSVSVSLCLSPVLGLPYAQVAALMSGLGGVCVYKNVSKCVSAYICLFVSARARACLCVCVGVGVGVSVCRCVCVSVYCVLVFVWACVCV